MPRLEDEIRRMADRGSGSVRTDGVYERLVRRKRWIAVRHRVGAGALAVTVLAGTVLGTSLLSRTFQPAAGGGFVAFTRLLEGCPEHPNVVGTREVFAVDVATGEERLVSHVPTWSNGSYRIEERPDFSPDGRSYVWVDHYRHDVYLTDVLSGMTRKLTNGLEVEQARFSPDGTQVLFSTGGEGTAISEEDLGEERDIVIDDTGEIYVVGLDGSPPRLLTNGHLPTWTNDGRIAFARTTSVVHVEPQGDVITTSTSDRPTTFFVMDADGSDEEELYEFDGEVRVRSAEWSPDGTRVAAEVIMDGQADIFVLDLETRIPVRVTDSPADDTSPTWSPDGAFIAFHTGRWGNFLGHAEIAMVPSTGGDVIRLTDDACFQDGDPSWIPNGSTVASLPVWAPPALPDLGSPGVASAHDILVGGETEGIWDLFAVDPSTGEVTNLTADLPEQLTPGWSPDHTRIAFGADVAERGNFDLYVMSADGSRLQRLTTDPEGEFRPSWSPDGSQIAYEGRGGIWIVNADGSNAHLLEPSGGYPSWSPDGDLIAFTDGSVRTVRPDGTGERELVHGGDPPNDFYEVEWSPDGSDLLFTCGRDICVVGADGSGLVNLTAAPGDTYEREADWSPDGSEIVFLSDRAGGEMRLFIMAADGSNVRELVAEIPGCCNEPDW